MDSGDGGQVLVDPTDSNYVYGTYFGISPYRNHRRRRGASSRTQFITNGINLTTDPSSTSRACMNQDNPNQLFLGHLPPLPHRQREGAAAGDVTWKPISPDLTSGCTGTAPNGARGCVISRDRRRRRRRPSTPAPTTAGSRSARTRRRARPDLDAGRQERPAEPAGREHRGRPVATTASRMSAFNGFNAATPTSPATSSRPPTAASTGRTSAANMPDAPVNSLLLDPTYPNTLYAGTDVGPFVTYNGGQTWARSAPASRPSRIWQLDLDPAHRHARGGHARPRRVHARRRPRRPGARAVEGRRRQAGRAGEPHRLHDHAPQHRQRRRDRRDDHRPDARRTRRSCRPATAARSPTARSRGAGSPSPAGGSVAVHFTVSDRRRARRECRRRSPTTASTSPRPGRRHDRHAARHADRAAVRGDARAGDADRRRRAGRRRRPTRSRPNIGSNDRQLHDVGVRRLPVTDGPRRDLHDAADDDRRPSPPGGTTTSASGSRSRPARRRRRPTPHGDGDVDGGPARVSARRRSRPSPSPVDTLLVDNDGQRPGRRSRTTRTALTAAGVPFDTWDLADGPDLPAGYLKAHRTSSGSRATPIPARSAPYEDG